jgi:hypothetical protein
MVTLTETANDDRAANDAMPLKKDHSSLAPEEETSVWFLESTIFPEGKVHLAEAVIFSVMLISLGTVILTAIFASV